MKASVEEQLHAKEHTVMEQTAELEKLRQDVVRLSQELGQQRGKADALSSQARSVARMEAEEIARLEDQTASLRKVRACARARVQVLCATRCRVCV